MQANAGNFELATQGLPTGQRQQLSDDPTLMKQAWNAITRDGTITTIKVKSEDRGPNGQFGTIDVEINYKDGSKFKGQTVISYLNDRWSFGLRELYQQTRSSPANERVDALKISLSKDYARIANSNVSLRVPEELIWDALKKEYDHPKYRIQLFVDSSPGVKTFDSLVKWVEDQWTSPQRILIKREDHSSDKVKTVLFDGDNVNAQGRGWRIMQLVIGEADNAVIVSATFPNQENYLGPLRECLTSARWEK